MTPEEHQRLRVLLTRWGMEGATEPSIALIADQMRNVSRGMKGAMADLVDLNRRNASVGSDTSSTGQMLSTLAKQIREFESLTEAIETWATMTAEKYRELFDAEDPKRRAGAN